jgi:hypothetical protein
MPHPAIAFRHAITRAGRTYKVEGPEVALARIIRSLFEGPACKGLSRAANLKLILLATEADLLLLAAFNAVPGALP